jgi:hypothetical protein
VGGVLHIAVVVLLQEGLEVGFEFFVVEQCFLECLYWKLSFIHFELYIMSTIS